MEANFLSLFSLCLCALSVLCLHLLCNISLLFKMSHFRWDWIRLSTVVSWEVGRWSWLHLDSPSLQKCFQLLCILATGLIFFLKSSSDMVLNPSLNATVMPGRETVYRDGHSLSPRIQVVGEENDFTCNCASTSDIIMVRAIVGMGHHQWKYVALNEQS